MNASLIWFRNDLRLDDNPALRAAHERGGPVVAVFIWAPEEEEPWAPGAASRIWLHDSLAALDASLRARGGALVLRRGGSLETLRALVRETGADAVFWNRRYEPACIARDKLVKEGLRGDGVGAHSSNGGLLFEPWEIATRDKNTPFQVFTPYHRACIARGPITPPRPAPRAFNWPASQPSSVPLAELALVPSATWAAGLRAALTPGEVAATKRLRHFLRHGLSGYAHGRDRPDQPGVSALSAHLHHGELSPRRVHAEIEAAALAGNGGAKRGGKVDDPGNGGARGGRNGGAKGGGNAANDPGGGTDAYLRELHWREFAHHLLFHFPRTPDEPLRARYAEFPWADAPGERRAWQRGLTGYPIVDAGLAELWRTGVMHNRVRMIAASFLVKHLLQPWQVGARWFWDTLVDADMANNTLGWQWTAGCGADAAPFFRIFNPIVQGERFDPDGIYVKRHLPVLAQIPPAFIHQPWKMPASTRIAAGVRLGENYPEPIVDHALARQRALAAFASLRA